MDYKEANARNVRHGFTTKAVLVRLWVGEAGFGMAHAAMVYHRLSTMPDEWSTLWNGQYRTLVLQTAKVQGWTLEQAAVLSNTAKLGNVHHALLKGAVKFDKGGVTRLRDRLERCKPATIAKWKELIDR